MKKIKLMLLSFALLAAVGGALAFNAKGLERFCTANPNANGTCPHACPSDRTGNFRSGSPWMCTTPTSGIVVTPCRNASGATLPCNTASVEIQLD